MELVLPAVDKSRAEPLYLQIRNLLFEAIQNGTLLPEQRVPSERMLSEITGVSRMTVRQALQQLIAEGLLYTVAGKGTFVTGGPKIRHDLQRLSGFTEEVRSQGIRPGSRTIQVDIVPAEKNEALALRIALLTPLIRITRLRLADNVPVALESTHLVQAEFPGLVRIDLESYSLYELLQNEYGVHLMRAEQMIEATEADQETAELLSIPVGKSVLSMERVTFSASDRPIEFVRSIYRADRFQLRVELHAGQPPESRNVTHVLVPG